MTAHAAWLPDGRRLHLQHGPIDLILEAWGPPAAVASAYARATARFAPLLDELVAELPALRSPGPAPARRRDRPRAWPRAVAPFRPTFITPMAAVAGAVADTILAAMTAAGDLDRAYVNDGGDIALHLAPGPTITAAIAARAGLPDRVTIRHADPVRGIATSGWRGRSFSLGIADAVTVLAATAAAGRRRRHPDRQRRRPPRPPGDHPPPRPRRSSTTPTSATARVTTAVGPLAPAEVATALAAGAATAEAMRARGLIAAAALFLAGECRIVGPLPLAAA